MATEHAESVAEEKKHKKNNKNKVGKPIGDPVRMGCPNKGRGSQIVACHRKLWIRVFVLNLTSLFRILVIYTVYILNVCR